MKIWVKNILMCLCFLISIISYAGVENQFDKANQSYIKKDYIHAIRLYDSLIVKGVKSAELYYNLGNAYYKNENLSKAILWYERALRLDPSNEDIKHNIAFVNQKIVDDMEIMPEFFLTEWIKNIYNLRSSNQWAIIAIAFCLVFLCVIVFMLLSSVNKRRIYLFFTAIIIFIFFALSLTFAFIQYNQRIRSDEAIITQLSVIVKSMPDESGTDLFTVHEGLKVKIEDKVGSWMEVVFPNGNKGWIQRSMVEII